MDQRYDFSNAHVGRWATHQMAGTGRPVSPQVAHRFEAFQKALPSLGPLQSTAVAQSVAHGHMTAFDRFGRLTAHPMQPRPDVASAGTGRGYCLHIRLVVVGDDFLRHQFCTLDGLAKERLGTRRVAMVTQQYVHDHTVLVNSPI